MTDSARTEPLPLKEFQSFKKSSGHRSARIDISGIAVEFVGLHLVIKLDLPPEVAAGRQSETSIDDLYRRRQVVRGMDYGDGCDHVEIDASATPEIVRQTVDLAIDVGVDGLSSYGDDDVVFASVLERIVHNVELRDARHAAHLLRD